MQKKQVVTDEWRHGNVEERLEYALVKVMSVFNFKVLFMKIQSFAGEKVFEIVTVPFNNT